MQPRFYLSKIAFSIMFVMGTFIVKAQQTYFTSAPTGRMKMDVSMTRNIKKLSFYLLKEDQLRSYLAKAPLEFRNNGTPLPLEVPLPNGMLETFAMQESPILSETVAAKHPEIKTYTGKGKTNSSYIIRISFTALGFNAIMLGPNHDAVYYDKVSKDKSDPLYRVYFASDAEKQPLTKTFGQSSKCGSPDAKNRLKFPDKDTKGARKSAAGSGDMLRTFRLAVAADAEFTNQVAYGGNGVSGGNVNLAFAGLVGYVNRINAIYRTELSVAFTLVSDVNLVYANTATDPYSNDDQITMLDENQANLNAVIGNANYDVGHVLGYTGGSGGGIASSPSVCDDPYKGQGVSGVGDGSYAPVFDDQLIAHEMGHQFGMSHSYNSNVPVCTTRTPETSVEPGSGTTIMSYGFTCSDATGNDDYEATYQPFLNFHTINYDQAQAYISTLTCFTATATNNSIPVISLLPANTTIPKSTPFALTGTATDSDAGNVLSYSWEGTNTGLINPDVTTLANTAQPPFFRSYEPVASGTRSFPRLTSILDGTNSAKGDKLPSVGITTTHRLTVRDNAGGVTYGDVTVTIADNSGPFLETTNLAGSYPGNSTRTITWDVANTTAAPVSCTSVAILLSTDGGLTFPTTLVANTPNDGSETITLPAVLTSAARIKVQSSNNIFFDISNTDFSIVAPQAVICQCPPITVTVISAK
ncbi:zinc-dependent metalloprotease family protein [Spirosoma migulaei]